METVEILRIIEGLAILIGFAAYALIGTKHRKEIAQSMKDYGKMIDSASQITAKAVEIVEQVQGVVYNSKTATTQEKEKEE